MWRAELRVFVTIHPSALLRLEDEEDRRSVYARFVDDLRSVERLAKTSPARQRRPFTLANNASRASPPSCQLSARLSP